MSIRVILLDMDGTLLGDSQVAISRRNMEVIQRALREGIQVVPCTGRVFDMMPPQLLTQEGLRYYVTSHGARVYDRQTGTTLYENVIPPEPSATLLRLLEGKGLYAEIAANGTIYFEKAVTDDFSRQPVPPHHLWYVCDRCYTAVEKPSEYFLKNGVGIEKINVYGIPEPLREPLFEAVTATNLIRHTRPGAGENLEFSHKTLDKLAATDALLQTLGLGYDEVMALGDSGSDLSIIHRARIGVAMGNAPQDVRQQADFVTATNMEDGVALALEKYLFTEEA